MRARRGDGSTCWAIFATAECDGIGVAGRPHRYSEPQGCCPDCFAVPIERSAA